MFDGVNYLLSLARANRLASENEYKVSLCSDLHSIEPMMADYQTTANFLMVMDAVDGAMVGGRPGWFNRRVYTVAIIARYQWDDLSDRNQKLAICREIYRQMLTRLIVERENFEYHEDKPVFLRTDNMQYREMEPYAMAGATGVVFTLRIDEPTNLEYNTADWL